MNPHEVTSLLYQCRAVAEQVLVFEKRFRFTGISDLPGNISITTGSREGETGTTDSVHPEATIEYLSTELEALQDVVARLDEAADSAGSQLDRPSEDREYCWQGQPPTREPEYRHLIPSYISPSSSTEKIRDLFRHHDTIMNRTLGHIVPLEKDGQRAQRHSSSVRSEDFTQYIWTRVVFLGLLPIAVAAASAGVVFYSRIPMQLINPNSALLQIKTNRGQMPIPLGTAGHLLDSVPVLIASIFLYCFSSGLFYFFHIHTRAQELIFAGIPIATAELGLISEFSPHEIVLRLLPGAGILAMIFAALPGRYIASR